MYQMNLSMSLKLALVLRGVKSKDLAIALKTTPQQVSLWCRTGEISRFNVVKICRFLKMKVSEFIALGETDEK